MTLSHRAGLRDVSYFDRAQVAHEADAVWNVFIATGDSRDGMTHGTIGGMLILDLPATTPQWLGQNLQSDTQIVA